jgi:hypothetical protein
MKHFPGYFWKENEVLGEGRGRFSVSFNLSQWAHIARIGDDKDN